MDLSAGARVELHSDGPVTGTVGAGCTLYNFGTDTCTAVVPATSPQTMIRCPPVP